MAKEKALPADKQEKQCCPKFDPASWDEKEVVWKDKLFAKDIVKSFLHIPLNMGAVMAKMSEKVKKADALPEDFLILSYEKSPWKSEQYFAINKEVAGLESAKISGTFLTKVFEGAYKEAPNWYREMENYTKGKGKEIKNIYTYYTTCPKCAKKYGKNCVVIFAEVN